MKNMQKRILKVATIQATYTSDTKLNRDNNEREIRKCSDQGADLVVLSELHDSLYFCQTENTSEFDLAVTLPGAESDRYAMIARECGIVLVSSFFEKRAPGLYHNTSVVIDRDGSVAGKYRKMHIPDDPAYYEKFYFTPGDIGFCPVKTSVGNLGILVCWDQWYPEAARIMALSGAEILVYPTAIGWESTDSMDEKIRQREAWITIQRAHAVANGIPVVSVNRVGYEPDPSGATKGITFWGSSFVAGPQGEILHISPDDVPQSFITEVDMSRSENVRRWWPFLRDRRIDAYNNILKRFND